MEQSVAAEAGLVQALRRGDPVATEQLVERYGDLIYRLAARITGVDRDAEQIAEETLESALVKIDTFAGDPDFGAWITRTAARAAYERRRARGPAAAAITLDDVLPDLDDEGHFEAIVDWSARIDQPGSRAEFQSMLADALDALPADYRTALVLRDVEGWCSRDVATILGMSLPAARSRVHRARLFVRQRVAARLAA